MFAETQAAHTPDLLSRAQGGDCDAFCSLCRPFEARLVRQAMALCSDSALAEDLAQETLVEAWKCLRRYNGRCHFFTWLCAILLNRHRNVRRQKRPVPFSALSHHEYDGASALLTRLVEPTLAPDLSAARAERDLLLQRSIETLPAKHREVIHLRFFVDDSLEGIAAALNCSVGTVKSRLFNALEKLRALQNFEDVQSSLL